MSGYTLRYLWGEKLLESEGVGDKDKILLLAEISLSNVKSLRKKEEGLLKNLHCYFLFFMHSYFPKNLHCYLPFTITGMEVILVGFSSDGLSNLLSRFPGQLLKQQEIYQAQLSFGFG